MSTVQHEASLPIIGLAPARRMHVTDWIDKGGLAW